MREPRFRLGTTIIAVHEAERVESFRLWVDGRILHHGPLGSGNPVPSGDMKPTGERIRRENTSLD